VNIWNEFSKLIGVSPQHAEDALYSERAARATLSRRGMFGASAALAAGMAFGFQSPPRTELYRLVYADTDGNYIWMPLEKGAAPIPKMMLARDARFVQLRQLAEGNDAP
jgi:hypothetical protein